MKLWNRIVALVLTMAMMASFVPAKAIAATPKVTQQVQNVSGGGKIWLEDLAQVATGVRKDTVYETSIKGYVVDETGAPLPQVSVSVFSITRKSYLYTQCLTDGQGMWQIDDAWVGDTYLVAYCKGGYVFSEPSLRCTATQGGTTVPTVTATKIEGLVCDPEDYTYTVDTIAETATITGYTGSDTALLLPGQLGGYPVKTIGNDAFRDKKSIVTVALPEYVTHINYQAFAGCAALEQVYFPNMLTNIGQSAFQSCTALAGVTLPESLTTIDRYAFRYCKSLESINFPFCWKSAGDSIFAGCEKLVALTVPEGVTAIPGNAFSQMKSLQSIALPKTLKEIGYAAFSGCSALASVTLPEGLTTVGQSAFESCTLLQAVALPDSVTTVDRYAFRYCTNLESIHFPLNWATAGNDIFSGCEKLVSIVVPDGVTSLPNSVFEGAQHLQSVTLPQTLLEIQAEAFMGCRSLETLALPESLTSIGQGAFDSCTKLQQLVIPDGVTTIARYALRNCSDLEMVTLPKSWINAGEQIFAGCGKLVSIVVPEGMTVLPDSAFEGADQLKNVTLPSSLTGVKQEAFARCTAMTHLILPETVMTLGSGVFDGCSRLEQVWVGEKVAEIGKNAFRGCGKVTIHGVAGSFAESYAGENAIPFSTEELAFDHVTIQGRVNGAGSVSVAVLDVAEGEFLRKRLLTDDQGLWQIEDARLGRSYLILYYKEGYTFSEATLRCTAAEDGVTVPPVTATGIEGLICKAEDYTYTVDALAESATITGYTGSDTALLLPSQLGGYPVKTIGNDAFRDKKNIVTVALPEYVTHINYQAFSGCTALKNVYFPTGLTNIGQSAFQGCNSLTEVVLPQGLTTIDRYAFRYCKNLESVQLPRCWKTAGNSIFAGCDRLTEITIPEGVTAVPGNAFENMKSLQRVRFPSTLKEIGYAAFSGCSALAALELPQGLTNIGQSAFESCAGLTQVALPEGVTTIDRYAFRYCKNLESVNFPLSWVAAGNDIFSGCEMLVSIVVPEGVTCLPDSVFEGAQYLEKVTLPATLLEIRGEAFMGCAALTAIEFPAGLTRIGQSAFESCTGLTQVVLPEGVTSIDRYAFRYCKNLESINFPLSWAAAGNDIFSGCEMLVSIVVPEGVTGLPDSVFEGAQHLQSVTLPQSLQEIRMEAFKGCRSLETLVLPESLTSIGQGAFESCVRLKAIWIPDGVTNISRYAFRYCSNLESVTLPVGWATAGNEIFAGCEKLVSIVVPEGVTALPISAFESANYLKNVTLPSTLTELKQEAFAHCTAMTHLILPETVTTLGSGVFDGCSRLEQVWVGAQVTQIGRNAFRGCGKVTIHGVAGSFAESYAGENALPFSTEEIAFDHVTIQGRVNGAESVSVAVLDVAEGEYLHDRLLTDENGLWQIEDARYGKTYMILYYKEGHTFSANSLRCVAVMGGTIVPEVTAAKIEGLICKAEDYTYTVDALAESATITGYTGSDTALLLPSHLGGYPVTAIGNDAFRDKKSLVTVALPEYVTHINYQAFAGCTSLKNVYFPNSLTNIGQSAFQSCTALTQVVLPDSVTTIDRYAFRYCKNLESINFPFLWTNSGDNIFDGCQKFVSIAVPEGVRRLPDSAFEGAQYLQAVTLPQSLQEIRGEAFMGCVALKAIELPGGLIHIGQSAFQSCTGLTQMVLPDSVTTIDRYAFRYCKNLESVNFPVSWASAGEDIFAGCEKIVSFVVPEGVTSLPNSVFEGAQYLQSVTLPQSLREIQMEAFMGCRSLESLVLPEALTSIGQGAFDSCTKLKEIRIPDGVTNISRYAFRHCSNLERVTLPAGWATAGNDIFAGCEKLVNVVLPESMTVLPENAFAGAAYLRRVKFPEGLVKVSAEAFRGCQRLRMADLPETVTSIGSRAFADCDLLRYVIIPNENCTIGQNAFSNSREMTLVCPLNSLATVAAIDYAIPYSASGSGGEDGLVDRLSSRYHADTNAMTTNGYITLTMDYSLSATQQKLQARRLLVKVPAGTELVEATMRLNGDICTNYTFDEDTRILSIPVAAASGSLRFSVKSREDRDVRSYAVVEYELDGKRRQEVVGIIDEAVELFTLYAESLTSSETIMVNGAAPAGSTVELFVDGEPAARVTASKAGAYQAELKLKPDAAEQIFRVSAECAASDETLSASCNVRYLRAAPALEGFLFYIDGKMDNPVDLYGLARQGIRPNITHTGSAYPYRFEIRFRNPETIDRLYVTSVRNNIKRSIPAVYDPATGVFVAEGYFDENDKRYVPGVLGLEYSLKHQQIQVGEEVDWEKWTGHISSELIQGVTITSEPTAVGSQGTIDFGELMGSLGKVVLNYSIDSYDNANGTSLGDLMKLVGIGEKVYAYLVPGEGNSRYWMLLDLRDPETILMITADASDIYNTAVQFRLTAAEFGSAIGGKTYVDYYDFASKVSNFTTGIGMIYDAYGICKDYDQLCDEIMTSSTITDKSAALEKAEELRDDQMAFMIVTTLLPLVIASGPMAGPALVFTAMISAMVVISEVFWQLRIADIKGEQFKIRWHIDPSGYVYDNETNARIQGVTVTAYWVEYDESEDFWDRKPADTEYGVLWNSLEYNQANPLVTDHQGRYAWDVPEGWWRVKFEKEGYETVWSEWLPVPPPQTEVNVGMTAIHTHEYSLWYIETESVLGGEHGVKYRLCQCGEKETATYSNPLTDVPNGKYFSKPIFWAYENGITKGKTAAEFQRDVSCTRKQIVTFLWRAAGQPEPKSMVNPFTDVKRGDQFEKAILWAYYEGITSGTGDGTTFSPENACTRKQIVTFLWRFYGQPAPESEEIRFTDVKNDRFAPAILWAAEQGITTGTGDGSTFSPEDTCTRGQIVTFLYRAMVG